MDRGADRIMRLVAHLDMDAFYASVELLRRPDLRGLPVVIGGSRVGGGAAQSRLGDYVGRGVVTTATYEARAHGVHSAMGLMKAAALAPNAVLLPADFDEYRRYSGLFKAAVAELAPAIEDRGIDEIYIELTDVSGAREPIGHDPLGGARALAQDIKNNVHRRTGLTCSIGLAPNKLLAKLASEMDKPDGLTVLTPADVPTRVWPLAVRQLNGIGPKAAQRLGELGVHTLGELAERSPAELVERFGTSYGRWLAAAAQGQDDRPVVLSSEPVSISRETTFERDLHPRNDREQLTAQLVRLCERVAADLVRKGYRARTFGVKLRFDDFRTVTRDQTVALPTAEQADILHAARECLKRITLSRRLRLLGVRAGGLSREGQDAVPSASAGAAKRLRVSGSPVSSPSTSPARAKVRAPVDPHSLPLFGDEDAGGAGGTG